MQTWTMPADSCWTERFNPRSVGLAPLQQFLNKPGWNGVADSRRVSQSRFPGSFDEHHVHNAQHLACFRVKQGTPTVAGIGRSVQLKDIETSSRAQTAYGFLIE